SVEFSRDPEAYPRQLEAKLIRLHLPAKCYLRRATGFASGAALVRQCGAIVQSRHANPGAAMRILHTADWHLADRLGRIDRTDDLRRSVERIADYCRAEHVEVLLVAGDLFSELAGAEALRDAIRHLQEVFAAFLKGGGTILAITGNHDKENFCQTLRHAMSLAAPLGDTP